MFVHIAHIMPITVDSRKKYVHAFLWWSVPFHYYAVILTYMKHFCHMLHKHKAADGSSLPHTFEVCRPWF